MPLLKPTQMISESQTEKLAEKILSDIQGTESKQQAIEAYLERHHIGLDETIKELSHDLRFTDDPKTKLEAVGMSLKLHGAMKPDGTASNGGQIVFNIQGSPEINVDQRELTAMLNPYSEREER